MPIIIRALNLLFRFIEYAIFIDVILSWVQPGKGNRLVQIVRIFTEPLLSPARRLQQKVLPQLPVDMSPVIVLLVMQLVSSIINSIL